MKHVAPGTVFSQGGMHTIIGDDKQTGMTILDDPARLQVKEARYFSLAIDEDL
jgi:hypothetical protein